MSCYSCCIWGVPLCIPYFTTSLAACTVCCICRNIIQRQHDEYLLVLQLLWAMLISAIAAAMIPCLRWRSSSTNPSLNAWMMVIPRVHYLCHSPLRLCFLKQTCAFPCACRDDAKAQQPSMYVRVIVRCWRCNVAAEMAIHSSTHRTDAPAVLLLLGCEYYTTEGTQGSTTKNASLYVLVVSTWQAMNGSNHLLIVQIVVFSIHCCCIIQDAAWWAPPPMAT